ncbi:MAG: hypothetical protein GTO03_05195 [Planctomycetales bacterium]|nr:hypothetical protein [Planctomycetales bacterium]
MRFVILYHRTPEGFPRPTHWDLMLEAEGVLKTWALREDPQAHPRQVVQLLGDHRLDFLVYEGPLSGDRGSVCRWDQGTYQPVQQTDDRWVVRLAGGKLQGQIELTRHPDRPDLYDYRFQ